jgi:hypothetical protein
MKEAGTKTLKQPSVAKRSDSYFRLPKLRPSSTSRRAAYKRNSRALSSPCRCKQGFHEQRFIPSVMRSRGHRW